MFANPTIHTLFHNYLLILFIYSGLFVVICHSVFRSLSSFYTSVSFPHKKQASVSQPQPSTHWQYHRAKDLESPRTTLTQLFCRKVVLLAERETLSCAVVRRHSLLLRGFCLDQVGRGVSLSGP